MAICNPILEFNRGFEQGAGFALGLGISRLISNVFSFGGSFFSGYSMPFTNYYGNVFGDMVMMPSLTVSAPKTGSLWDNVDWNRVDGGASYDLRGNKDKRDINLFDGYYAGTDNQVYTHKPSRLYGYKVYSADTFTPNNSKCVTLDGYNKDAGEKLASIAWKNHTGFGKQCAKYVSNALKEANLSSGERGDGYQMAGILRNNSNFKEIDVDSVDWKNLPAGCVLCYDRGAQGYSNEYGHTEISTGNGTAVSDGVTHNIKKPSAIFMPV